MFSRLILPNLSKVFVSDFTNQQRSLWKWVNSIFNKVDHQRIKDVGPDQAAAEWLLRCGASVRWQSKDKWVKDYDDLLKQLAPQNLIEEIDATESCVMDVGFFYLNGLTHLKKIKFSKCIYLDDTCMDMLSVTKNSLQHLEIMSCGNVSDRGLHAAIELKNLKYLYLFDLPEVRNKEECVKMLEKNLPKCKVVYD